MTNRSWTKSQLNYYGIPERMHSGIVRYVEHGIPAGHFLQAVFENDLLNAALSADEENHALLGAYGKLLINQLPPASYGTPQKVRDWIKRGGIKGNLAHEPLPQHQWSRWAV